ncbi:hypothetical protein PMAYCL1PPCAC_08434, partial [Pristionchus mayeri]
LIISIHSSVLDHERTWKGDSDQSDPCQLSKKNLDCSQFRSNTLSFLKEGMDENLLAIRSLLKVVCCQPNDEWPLNVHCVFPLRHEQLTISPGTPVQS